MKRNNKACIYTSSYDRGLEHLLEIWPDVKKAVPEAKLHVFYGWQLFEAFYKDNPASMSWKVKIDKLLTQDGVTHHGRVSQPEIKKWYKKCGIWTYPTHFGEIQCISALKSQVWGAIPVVINLAALETSVKYGVKVEGDIYDSKTKELYKDELIRLLKDDERQEKLRDKMIKNTKKLFSWKNVAKQWDKEFKTYEK